MGHNQSGQLLVGDPGYGTSQLSQILQPQLNNCQVFFIPALGISDAAVDKISVYPNPSSKFINLSNPSHKQIDEIILYSIRGEKIREFNRPQEQIDISDLSNGVYFIKLSCENQMYQLKFIKA
ncbi:T9SS type A sorting domain-containing protein [Flavobacterium sp. 3HN19-14]|uniref:T9SS type A sorting domain-containing protein n=1 Tax=Flavobacterium sp. 3HN19-14 TaxID=3448133 RepID=UPI003EE191D1